MGVGDWVADNSHVSVNGTRLVDEGRVVTVADWQWVAVELLGRPTSNAWQAVATPGSHTASTVHSLQYYHGAVRVAAVVAARRARQP